MVGGGVSCVSGLLLSVYMATVPHAEGLSVFHVYVIITFCCFLVVAHGSRLVAFELVCAVVRV